VPDLDQIVAASGDDSSLLSCRAPVQQNEKIKRSLLRKDTNMHFIVFVVLYPKNIGEINYGQQNVPQKLLDARKVQMIEEKCT
jgi:hypothetical protein